MALTTIVPQSSVTAIAADERALYLYYTHTKETARIVYKRNGRYDEKGLSQLNQFLRDWRRNEPAKMDPRLFDLIWSVYNEVGASQPIHIVSAYRSPKTNEMLRSKSSGVAENSQHTKGNAMDFFIPGVPLDKLRAVAMRHQVGGVGYYPTSGSPFVHLDTGSVRAWPRMTRAQLQKVFPDGRTLHLPTDGKPISQEGRRYAEAEWKKCRTVPCNGAAARTMLASNDSGSKQTIMGMLFGGADEADKVTLQTASYQPEQRSVQTIAVSPPIPAKRSMETDEILTASIPATPASIPFSSVGSAPLDGGEYAAGAPVPATMSRELLIASRPEPAGSSPQTALSALAAIDAPQPALRGPVDVAQQAVEMTAYAPALQQDPEAQKALQMIIERATAEQTAVPAPPPAPTIDAGAIRTASLNGNRELATVSGLVDMTWNAFGGSTEPEPVPKAVEQMAAAKPLPGVRTRNVELVAPDLEHVHETFVQPVQFSSRNFAVLYEPDQGEIDDASELGPHVHRAGFRTELPGLAADRFTLVQ